MKIQETKTGRKYIKVKGKRLYLNTFLKRVNKKRLICHLLPISKITEKNAEKLILFLIDPTKKKLPKVKTKKDKAKLKEVKTLRSKIEKGIGQIKKIREVEQETKKQIKTEKDKDIVDKLKKSLKETQEAERAQAKVIKEVGQDVDKAIKELNKDLPKEQKLPGYKELYPEVFTPFPTEAEIEEAMRDQPEQKQDRKEFMFQGFGDIERYMNGEGILKTLSLKAFKTLSNLYRKTVKGARPLEDGELHFLAGNFIGPGTKIEKYRNVKPLNRPDAVAKQHDIDYYEAEQKFKKGDITKKERKELIRLADNKMIRALKAMGKLEGIEERYRQAGLKGIQFKRKVENVSPSLAKQLLPADLIGKKRKSLLEKKKKSEDLEKKARDDFLKDFFEPTPQEGGLIDQPEEALSNVEIENIMKKYKNFLGVSPVDTGYKLLHMVKPKSNGGLIYNLDKAGERGSHWVAVYYDARPGRKNNICYYDSFGRDIPKEIQGDIKQIVKLLDCDKHLKLKINRKVNQDKSSVSCGYLCALFLMDMMRGKSFKSATGFSVKKNEDRAEDLQEKFDYIIN